MMAKIRDRENIDFIPGGQDMPCKAVQHGNVGDLMTFWENNNKFILLVMRAARGSSQDTAWFWVRSRWDRQER